MRIFECDKPVSGAVTGWTISVGSWLALITHITIASERAGATTRDRMGQAVQNVPIIQGV